MRSGYKIIVTYINPPIPDRRMDWCAYLEDWVEDTTTYGYGLTPDAAIRDFADQFESWLADKEHDE